MADTAFDRIRVLCLAREEITAEVRRTLRAADGEFDVPDATTTRSARRILESAAVDCLVCDVDRLNADAQTVLPGIGSADTALPVVLLCEERRSGHEDIIADQTTTTTFLLDESPDRCLWLGRRIRSHIDSCRARQELEHGHEQKLETNRTRVELALEATDAVVWEWDLETDRLSFEPHAEVVFDEPIETPDDFFPQVHPDDRDRIKNEVENALDGDRYSVEYRLGEPDLDGNNEDRHRGEGTADARWISTDAQVFFDGDDPKRFLGFSRDITARKWREQRLRRYRQAVEASNDMLTAVDEDRTLLFANEEYRKFYGIDRDGYVGRPIDEMLDEDTLETARPMFDRALSGETVHYQMNRSRPNRPDRIFDIRYDPIESPESGEIEGAVAVLRDVTELEERNRQLRVLDRVFRHNIRNATNVIVGNADRLTEAGPEWVAERAAPIADRGDELMRLAEKERDIVELLAEPPTVHRLDIAETTENLVHDARVDYPAVDFDLDVPESAPVDAIPSIDRAVHELIENAVHHSEDDPARVEIGVDVHGEKGKGSKEKGKERKEKGKGSKEEKRVTGRETEKNEKEQKKKKNNEVTVAVADTGPGIPSEERAILTGEAAVSSVEHGRGLGMWLVHLIVSHSDGTVSVAGNDPRGSIVRLTLPRK